MSNAATILSFDGKSPRIHSAAWAAPTAIVIGDATIAEGASIFYGAVVRADTESITIGTGSNIQDNVVIHADPGFPASIGADVSVGHGAVLHGCEIQDGTLIGMNATVLNGAVIGAGSLVAAGALVLEGAVIPPRSLVAGVPAKVRRELTDEEQAGCLANATNYAALSKRHADVTGNLAGIPAG